MMTGLAVVTFTVLVLGVQSSYGVNSTNEACRNPVYHVQNLHQTNHCVVSKPMLSYLAICYHTCFINTQAGILLITHGKGDKFHAERGSSLKQP